MSSNQQRPRAQSSSTDMDDLSKSYEDHMRSFEAQIDLQAVSRSPKSRSTSMRSSSKTQQSTSPDEQEISDAMPLPNRPVVNVLDFPPSPPKSGSTPAQKSKGSSPQKAPVPATTTTKPAAGGTKQAKNAPAAERGPKVDMKSLSKAEKRALAQQQQEKAKAKKEQYHGGAKKDASDDKDKEKKQPGVAAAHQATKKESAPPANKKDAPAAEKKAKPVADGGEGHHSNNKSAGATAAVSTSKRVPYFLHVPDFTKVAPRAIPAGTFIHPEVIKLGVKYANGTIRGSSARCAALVKSLECVVRDYSLPPKTELSKHFMEAQLRPIIRYLVECRPKAVSMGNFIRGFKNRVTQCRGKAEAEAKEWLLEYLAEFIDERLFTAQQMIVDIALKKIAPEGDVILVYTCSYVVSRILIAAHQAGRKFKLIVVEGGGMTEGKQMLYRMSAAGISCTYVGVNALSYMMKGVTKVLLGAAALLSNGNLVSRVGTAMVAMCAHEYHVPVIVCCETIKFSAKCMLDSITWNELGDPDELNDCAGTARWKDPKSTLTLLSVRYDVCPIDYITMVICEFGMIPPTSVPVILREYDITAKEK